MSTTRDYYEVLGVQRDADDAEIKKAFRALARELHPDVNKEPDAELRFREVAEAYEVLSDAERRQTYDRYGHAGLQSGGFRPSEFDFSSLSDLFSAFFGDGLFGGAGGRGAQRAARGPDLAVAAEITLAEAFRGREISIPTRVARACEACDGSGAAPGTRAVMCTPCSGRGQVQHVSQNVFGQFVRASTCGNCGGTGQVVETPCTACHGEGRIVTDHTVTVDVPAGIQDGQRIRLRGEGHAGAGGAPPGDAYVEVRVVMPVGVERDGDDLHALADLSITQAALGATIRIPGADGEIEVEIQSGVQPGDVVVLRGRGMPALRSGRRGDFHVHVRVNVPRRLTAEQRERLLELERDLGDDAYESDDEGFFSRLRSAFR